MTIPTTNDFFVFMADAVAAGIRKADAERAAALAVSPTVPTAPVRVPPDISLPPAPSTPPPAAGVINSPIGSPSMVPADQGYYERSMWIDAYLKNFLAADGAAAVAEFRKAFPQ